MEKALREETARDEVSVIIAQRPCALLIKGNPPPYTIEGCKNCGVCMKLSCPAMERREDRVVINPALCTACGMCAQVCAFGAIREGVQR